jgi:hypothetical protein
MVFTNQLLFHPRLYCATAPKVNKLCFEKGVRSIFWTASSVLVLFIVNLKCWTTHHEAVVQSQPFRLLITDLPNRARSRSPHHLPKTLKHLLNIAHVRIHDNPTTSLVPGLPIRDLPFRKSSATTYKRPRWRSWSPSIAYSLHHRSDVAVPIKRLNERVCRIRLKQDIWLVDRHLVEF